MHIDVQGFSFTTLRSLLRSSVAGIGILSVGCLPNSIVVCASAQAQLHRPWNWNWRASEGWPLQPSLKTARIPKAQRDAIFKASFHAFVSEGNWKQIISPESEWPKAIWEERIRLRDLDGDGTPEVMLMGGGAESSGDGNSSFRILKRQGSGYKVIFDDIAERVNFDTRIDPKHPVIALYTHFSASQGGLELDQVGTDGMIHYVATYDVSWPTGAFEGEPALERSNQRAAHFNH